MCTMPQNAVRVRRRHARFPSAKKPNLHSEIKRGISYEQPTLRALLRVRQGPEKQGAVHGSDDSHARHNVSDTRRRYTPFTIPPENDRGIIYPSRIHRSQRPLPVRFWEKVQKVLLEHAHTLAAQIHTGETQCTLSVRLREKVQEMLFATKS